MKTKKIFPLIILITISVAVTAQSVSIGLHGAAGATLGKNLGLSFDGGIAFTKALNIKFDIGTGINISRFSVKDNNFKPLVFGTDIINQMNGMPTESYLKSEYNSHLTFIGIPVFIKYRKEKIAINMGVKALFYSSGYTRLRAELNESGDISYVEHEEKVESRFIGNNLGPELGVEYYVTERLALVGDVFYGFSKIRNGEYSDERNIGQAVIGLSYYLTKQNLN